MEKFWKVVKIILVILLICVIVFSIGSICRACSDKTPGWIPSWELFDRSKKDPIPTPDPDLDNSDEDDPLPTPDDPGDGDGDNTDKDHEIPKPPVYTITFDANGGSLTGADKLQTNVEFKLDRFPTDPTRDNYVFTGWARKLGDNFHPIGLSYTYSEDTTVYAQWREIAHYTITFDANGGTLSGTDKLITQPDGTLEALPENPTRDGYSFYLWGTLPGCGVWVDSADRTENDESDYNYGKAILSTTVFTSDTTIYAWYKKSDNGGSGEDQGDPDDPTPGVYTITFDANGGSLIGADTLQTNSDGKLSALPEDPVLEDNIFAGWFTQLEGGNQITTSTVFSSDMTVYAHWTVDGSGKDPDKPDKPDEPTPTLYTITFDPNGGSLAGANILQTNTDGKLSTLPQDPIREDHSFIGWFTQLEGGDQVTTSTVFTADTTVYARWRELVKYTITFDGNGGTLTGPATLQTNTNGKLAVLPQTPTRQGYAFLGWFDAAASGNQVTTSTVFTADTTVYAYWREATVYTITFNPGSGTLIGSATLQTDNFGKLKSLPSDPTRQSYNFVGWYTQNDVRVTYSTVFTSDTTVYAKWSEETYTVNFDFNGGLLHDAYGNTFNYAVSCYTGSNFKLVSPPAFAGLSRDNYLFCGWLDENGVEKTLNDGFMSDTTLTAKWLFDDSSFGVDGDRTTNTLRGNYAYMWNSSRKDCVTGIKEYKIMVVFDSPTTRSCFEVSISDTTFNEFTVEITPTGMGCFTVDEISVTYPDIDFGFAGWTYSPTANGGVYCSFTVSSTFFTDLECYLNLWVTTSHKTIDLSSEIVGRVSVNDDLNCTVEYKGFSFYDNFILYIHTTSPYHGITNVTFSAGEEIGIPDEGSAPSGAHQTIEFKTDYSMLNGGSYAFPISALLDELGELKEFSISVTVTPTSEIPNAEQCKFESITVESAAEIQHVAYYNSDDGLVSFEYYGDISEYMILVESEDDNGSRRAIPILRHYTYSNGGSVIFEWDGSVAVTVRIFSLNRDTVITSDITVLDPFFALSELTDYAVYFDDTQGLIYLVYSGNLGNYDVTLSGFGPLLRGSITNESDEQYGYNYLVFAANYDSDGGYTLELDTHVPL